MKKAIILAGIYWNDPIQRHQQFAMYLSNAGYEVYFIEHIVSAGFSINRLLRAVRRRAVKNAHSIKSGNVVPPNINIINIKTINPHSGAFFIVNKSKINNLILSLGDDFDIVINYLPINTTRYLVSKIRYTKLIYDCVRNFTEWGEYPHGIEREEQWLIEKSDLIFTDSYYLTKKMEQRAYHKVRQFLPIANTSWENGCKEVKITKIKNIGYFGSLDEHISLEILNAMSDKGYKIHIWGNVITSPQFNYIYHGYQNDLGLLSAQICETCDAIVLPYRGNMDGVIPAKMLQCLSLAAMGIPIFVSEFYDSKQLEEYIYIFRGREELILKIENYNSSQFEEKRIKIVDYMRDKNETNQQRAFWEQMV